MNLGLHGEPSAVTAVLQGLDPGRAEDRAEVVGAIATRAPDPQADEAVADMARFLASTPGDDDVERLLSALTDTRGPAATASLAVLLRGRVPLPAALGGDGPDLRELTRAHLRLAEPAAALAPPLRSPTGEAASGYLRPALTAEVALAMSEQLRTAGVELPQLELAMAVFAARGRPALARGTWTDADRDGLLRQQRPELTGSERLSEWLLALAEATREPPDLDAATHFLARVRMVWLLTANAPAPA